jgi:3-oxoadipate enol-lactonase
MRYKGTDIEIMANNLKVSYTDEGPDDAPVIILIHGFPFNKSMWNKQVETLIENYRVIAYDVRGHGNSDAGSEDFSIELFVRDLLSLMDALKIEKATLIGLSMGGYIALNAIINFPKHFDALILCDTTCMSDSPEAKEKRMNTIESIKAKGIEQYASESVKKLFAPESFVTSKDQIDRIKTMIMDTSQLSLTRTLLALSNRTDTCNKLAEIAVPVLIMVGKEDQITPPSAAHLMQENIKGSILKIVEHAGHLCNIENTYEFNNYLMDFVSSVNQRPDKRIKRDLLVPEVINSRKAEKDAKTEKDLNSKILKVTMTIKDHYPELSKYIEEMPVTVPSDNDPEITLKHLSAYYESLNSLLDKYKQEYPKIEE